MATATQPFTGVYELDRNHSTVQFAVRHVQVSKFARPLPLSDGSDALGWDVEITVQLELVKKD